MSEITVDVRNVRKEYGQGNVQVLAVVDVSLRIRRGEVVLILGPSGSGKTTLLSMIGAILRPTSGEISINGERISGMSERELPRVRRQQIGFVFQGFNLLKSLTVQENVQVALNLNGVRGREAREKSQGVLTELGLGDRLGFHPADLSGGEKQRVSIARAIVSQPKVILADEPTGNLDSKTGRQIGQILRGLAQDHGATVVIVTHDTRLEQIADRVLYLEDGVVREERRIGREEESRWTP
jgi:putative ABC transport system ATP-binding protein